MSQLPETESHPETLAAQDLLSASQVVHEVELPAAILRPGVGAGATGSESGPGGVVRLQPLTVGTLALISRASREDPSLVPLLTIQQCLVEPALDLDRIRQLNVGIVHFLIERIHEISGLGADGQEIAQASGSATGEAHVLLARHFGWTPQQVAQLTPGQVAVYLAGIERLLALDEQRRSTPEE